MKPIRQAPIRLSRPSENDELRERIRELEEENRILRHLPSQHGPRLSDGSEDIPQPIWCGSDGESFEDIIRKIHRKYAGQENTPLSVEILTWRA